jgi:hypothetical protein
MRTTMQFNTCQKRQLQTKLWRPLILLHKLVLCEDTSALGKLLQTEELAHLHNLT